MSTTRPSRAEYQRMWRKQNPDKWKEIIRKYQGSEKGKATSAAKNRRRRAEKPELYAEYRRRNRIKFPEKALARTTLWRAIRAGRVIRPSLCQQCGFAGPIEGHHHDYSKPLDVNWLCKSCHELTHRLETI